MTHTQKRSMFWTLAITSVALFMVSLDNLVVTTALPVIRRDLHASISQLEWTVNAYTLTFAVLLLTGAALGDRFGRRRLFALGLLLFTGASAAAALSTSANGLDIARAVQGVGGAIVTPLTLTILSAAVPRDAARPRARHLGRHRRARDRDRPARRRRDRERRLVALDLLAQRADRARARAARARAARGDARRRLARSTCPGSRSRAPACSASSGASSAATRTAGRASASSSRSSAASLLVAAFVAWELRAASPMLPMQFFRNRTFALTNVASLLMFFGMFGSIFLLAQFFQTVQGYSPLQSGLRILPWTAMPIFVAPIAGALSDRIGGQRLMALGLALQATGLAWIAAVTRRRRRTSSSSRRSCSPASAWRSSSRPVANVVLSSVRPEQEGKASGANNAIRELGGVFGVAVLASVFAHVGGYRTALTFVHGTTTAVYVGAARRRARRARRGAHQAAAPARSRSAEPELDGGRRVAGRTRGTCDGILRGMPSLRRRAVLAASHVPYVYGLTKLGRVFGTDKVDASHTRNGLAYTDVYERYLRAWRWRQVHAPRARRLPRRQPADVERVLPAGEGRRARPRAAGGRARRRSST